MAAAEGTSLAFKVKTVFIKAFLHDLLRVSQSNRFENPQTRFGQFNNQRKVGRGKHYSFSIALH